MLSNWVGYVNRTDHDSRLHLDHFPVTSHSYPAPHKTVETFLDRKVRYVVTDKPQKDWPADSKQAPPNLAVEKQQENKLELMGLTRGKMLATKAPSTSAKTKDVLETALRLNMKILTHRSILDFCKKYIKVPLDDVTAAEQANEQEAAAAAAARVKVRQLKAPFLKFEDKEEKFAPVYKEFDIWPAVCMESNSSSLTNTNATNQPTVPKNFNTSKLLQPPMQKKRQRVFFCEICSKDFTNMIEVGVQVRFNEASESNALTSRSPPALQHVKTEQHQIYMNNEENYKELRSVIDSLPNWITLNDTSAFDENDEFTDEESEFEDEDSEFDDDAYSSVSGLLWFLIELFLHRSPNRALSLPH